MGNDETTSAVPLKTITRLHHIRVSVGHYQWFAYFVLQQQWHGYGRLYPLVVHRTLVKPEPGISCSPRNDLCQASPSSALALLVCLIRGFDITTQVQPSTRRFMSSPEIIEPLFNEMI